jgi:Tfp pilus assembly protein PilF
MPFKKRWLYGVIPMMGILGCETPHHQEETMVSSLYKNASWQMAVRRSLEKLKSEDLNGALLEVNLALQNFPKKSSLHLINGLVYEERGCREGGDFSEMAMVGYKNAFFLDPGNWYAYYRMGFLKIKEGAYGEAQEFLSKASLLKPKDPYILYHLAMASYYAEDLKTARLSIQKALQHKTKDTCFFLRAAAVIFAAAGEKKQSKRYFEELKQTVGQKEGSLPNLQERVEKWLSFHQKKLYRQVEGVAGEAPAVPVSSLPAASVEKEVSPNPVIIFDCCGLLVKDQVIKQRGTNLLSFTENLNLQVQPQSLNYNYTTGTGSRADVSKLITWPTINYNLNIMNIVDNRIEILGRPSMSTFLQKKGTFFSGPAYYSGITGSAGGSLITIPSGTTLTITPLSVEGELVTLDIIMESTIPAFQERVLASPVTGQILNFLKTKIETKMQLKFNETGMIAGLYSRNSTYNQDGIPILQEIPIVQFFTSRETTQDTKVSALFLVTPKRPEGFLSNGKKQDKQKTDFVAQWLNEHSQKDNDYSLIVENISKLNATQYYARGDIIALNDSPIFSLREEIARFDDIFYF